MTDFNNWPTLDSFIPDMKSKYFWVSDSLISEPVVQQLLELANSKYSQDDFRPARVGKDLNKKRVDNIRGDEISWIEDWQQPGLVSIKNLLDMIMLISRQDLFLPLKRFESHFAVYKPGTYYKKHRDQHKHLPSRVLSCVIYLSDWKPHYGGQLTIYDEDLSPINIEPRPGRIVVFDSRLEHEVRSVNSMRWSLTTWFRDDIHNSIHL